MTRAAIVLPLLIAAAMPVAATEYQFSYNKLFAQLKNNVKEGHQDVKVAYFMQNPKTGNVCKLNRAWMQKKEHFEEFSIPASQELPLPIDNHLRKVNPDVFVDVDESAGICNMTYQVMTSSVPDELSKAYVMSLLPQMQTMMSDLGGMFASWFMPEVKGVVLHFPQNTPALESSLGNTVRLEDGRAIIDVGKLADGETIRFDTKPVKITPWIPKA
ncbi:DUF2987 domain-containing protein [Parasalinivibrio latis]|uniref:DUF2987 domain-containing protein n=1 Tax=Parasalinivibrio latis TaxID=2952610 RepID=UPI0030DDF4C9